MALKGSKIGQGPSMGTMPKGKSSSGRTLDHVSAGKPIPKRINLGKPNYEQSGGAAQEVPKKIKVPATKCYAQGPGQRKSSC